EGARRIRARGRRDVRPHLRLRSGHAPLPRQAGNRPRHDARARRAAALRRATIRPRRPQDPCARFGARERDARGGRVTPAETVAIEAREAGITPLEALLRRGRLRATLMMLGPAFVASIAYVDPGNFATNIAGGARFGYLLRWVALAANRI